MPATCGSPTGCHCSSTLKTLTLSLFKLDPVLFPFSLEPPNQFYSHLSGVSYRVTENAQTLEKTPFSKIKITKDLN